MDILTPADDEYLAVEEVLTRLRQEFAVVHTDPTRGAGEIDQEIEYLRRLQSKGLNPFGGSLEDRIAALETQRGEAMLLIIADRDDADAPYLRTTLRPSEPISFGYPSLAMMEKCKPLLERCARALGYEIETQ